MTGLVQLLDNAALPEFKIDSCYFFLFLSYFNLPFSRLLLNIFIHPCPEFAHQNVFVPPNYFKHLYLYIFELGILRGKGKELNYYASNHHSFTFCVQKFNRFFLPIGDPICMFIILGDFNAMKSQLDAFSIKPTMKLPLKVGIPCGL